MEFPEIKYIGIIFLWEYLQLTVNIFIRRKKSSQNWAEMSMTVMPAKFLCIIVVVWRVADKDSYIAQAAAQWFQVAKNPPKTRQKIRSFDVISLVFSRNYQQIHIISVSGYCMRFILKFVKQLRPVNFTIFGSIFWRGFDIWPNCALCSLSSLYSIHSLLAAAKNLCNKLAVYSKL